MMAVKLANRLVLQALRVLRPTMANKRVGPMHVFANSAVRGNPGRTRGRVSHVEKVPKILMVMDPASVTIVKKMNTKTIPVKRLVNLLMLVNNVQTVTALRPRAKRKRTVRLDHMLQIPCTDAW